MSLSSLPPQVAGHRRVLPLRVSSSSATTGVPGRIVAIEHARLRHAFRAGGQACNPPRIQPRRRRGTTTAPPACRPIFGGAGQIGFSIGEGDDDAADVVARQLDRHDVTSCLFRLRTRRYHPGFRKVVRQLRDSGPAANLRGELVGRRDRRARLTIRRGGHAVSNARAASIEDA